MKINEILKKLDDYNYKKDYENSYNYVFCKKFGFGGMCKRGSTTGKHRNLFVNVYCDGIKIEYVEQEKIEEIANNLGL